MKVYFYVIYCDINASRFCVVILCYRVETHNRVYKKVTKQYCDNLSRCREFERSSHGIDLYRKSLLLTDRNGVVFFSLLVKKYWTIAVLM